MGVSRTQVVRFLRQGADAVNIIVSGDNIVFTDAGQVLVVSIEVYIGTEKLQYGSGSDNTFVCSTLSSGNNLFDGNGIWGFRIDDTNTKFTYLIGLKNKVDLSTTIPYTITINDIPYNKSISVSTVYKGERGATLRGPQDWESLNTGYQFYSGADGESYLDCVVYEGFYYMCKKSHTKNEFNFPKSSFDNNSGLWQLADNIDMVATKLLLATYLRVKNLGAGAIEMEDKEGNLVFVAKDGNVTCKKGTFENVDVSGVVHANLMYSSVKTFVEDYSGSTTYNIDTINEPANTYFINTATGHTKFIYLPDANTYSGLELNFYQTVLTNAGMGDVFVAATNSQYIYYNTVGRVIEGNVVPTKLSIVARDTRIKISANEVVRLKAMNGAWYVMTGLVTEE